MSNPAWLRPRGDGGRFQRMDGWAPAPEALTAMAVRETRYCVYCGHAFECYGGSQRMVCSPKCNIKRWRAVSMLAGTHGYMDGRFQRL